MTQEEHDELELQRLNLIARVNQLRAEPERLKREWAEDESDDRELFNARKAQLATIEDERRVIQGEIRDIEDRIAEPIINFPLRIIPDGPITVDSEAGRMIGLTSRVFVKEGERGEDIEIVDESGCAAGSQFFKEGDVMNIQQIEVRASKRCKGHFTRLLERLSALGFTVKIIQPQGNMRPYCRKRSFREITEMSTSNPRVEIPISVIGPQQNPPPAR
ncbi:MAG: hypothetical protein WCH99_14005 [Verrucomicrobiota bacterium]